MLHITDGESVAGTLRKSAVTGAVSTYGDMMYEGPALADLGATQWREIRARFMSDADYASLEEARKYLQACQDTLSAYSQHEEVVIWLDHRLSNQLILVKVLDWFSRQNLGAVKLTLLCIGQIDGVTPFGLGALEANQLLSLVDTRRPVTEAQFRTAQTAWRAFTSPNPKEIERFIRSDTSALPFVGSALRRHLEQFPSVHNGLSRTEQQALSFLNDKGALSGAQLFVAVQHMEEAVFMGDTSFYRIMSELSRAPYPLVQMNNATQPHRAELAITETGRRVLAGEADHVKLNGMDRWLGGVHLSAGKPIWRWDQNAERIVGPS
ncbi:MAG TPA: DUF1835 domain-containing protein [Terriglobia bacterium]|nr:DUF1835 domain-containing protein [Terriglobia bacterium]